MTVALLVCGCGASSPILQVRRAARVEVAASAQAQGGLPPIVSSLGSVQALWQAPLVRAHVLDGLVFGLVAGEHRLDEVRAVSELTGQTAWSAKLPAGDPWVLGLVAGAGVVVAEVGQSVGKAPGLVGPAITRDLVFDAGSGRELWQASVEGGTEGRLQHQPLALSGHLMITGDAVGNLTARDAQSGATVWTRPHPAPCAPGREPEELFREALAAEGPLLVASYWCDAAGRAFARAERLSESTGKELWRWDSPHVPHTPSSFVDLSVVALATHGNTVVLEGQVSNASRLAATLPRRRRWPAILGPFGESDLLVALDSGSGRPRWSEQGGQEPTITMSDGVTCETTAAGFECRDDGAGAASRPLVRTTRTEADSPPFIDDGMAGINGAVGGVVFAQARSGATSVAVYPLRGHGAVARASVQLGATVCGEGNDHSFIVGAGPLPHGETLLLLRRVDVAGCPLVALAVKPARTAGSEPQLPTRKHRRARPKARIYVAADDCQGRTFMPSHVTLDCAHPKRLYVTEIGYFPGEPEGYGSERGSGSMTIHVLRAPGRYEVNKGGLTLERPVRCADGFLYYSRAFYAYPEGQARVDIEPRERCRPVHVG